jgi:hypothetical protein
MELVDARSSTIPRGIKIFARPWRFELQTRSVDQNTGGTMFMGAGEAAMWRHQILAAKTVEI